MRVVLEEPPNSLRLYAKAALASRRGDGQLPPTELVLPGVEVERRHLAAYARVCGYPVADDLPGCYLHVLAFPLGLQLMTAPDFPFAVKGLVHISNQFTLSRPVLADERLTLRVRLDGLGPHRRGTQFDVVSEVEVQDETVWSERSTYLRREQSSREPSREPSKPGEEEPPSLPLAGRWRVPADLGRAYARVSGDFNPIHLHPLSARLFGYRRQIAHGMWTKARCLAAFQGRLPESYSVEVSFAAPIFLPSSVSFQVGRKPQQGWDFEVLGRQRPALRGTIRPG